MIIRKSNQSNKLLVFHLDLHVWSTIDVKGFVPRGRAFHSAVLIGDYMIIYGKRNRHLSAGLTLHTLTSVCIFSLVFSIHFLRC